jgi:hypothetical protein
MEETKDVKDMYFTPEEIAKIDASFELVSNAKLNIKRKHTKDEQLNVFFDKAKLWRAVQKTIEALFLEKLLKGKLFLTDQSGYRYTVIPMEVKNEDTGAA